MASAVYGAKIMKDLNLIPSGYKIMVVGSVQEEDCDGMCWQYIYNQSKIVPEFVISTEPTDGGIYRGHRGRMEIREFPVTVLHQNVVTMQSIKWRIFFRIFALSTRTRQMTV